MAMQKTKLEDLEHAMEIHRTVYDAIEDKDPGYAQTTIDGVILSLECQDGGVGHYHGGPVSGSAYEFQGMLIMACAKGKGRATKGVFPRSRIEHMIDDLRAFGRKTQDRDAKDLEDYLKDNEGIFA